MCISSHVLYISFATLRVLSNDPRQQTCFTLRGSKYENTKEIIFLKVSTGISASLRCYGGSDVNNRPSAPEPVVMICSAVLIHARRLCVLMPATT
jgi:hypothetical protein